MTDTQTTPTLEEEIAEMDREIERLEAELNEESAPLVWGEVSIDELARNEQRRSVLPRLITAAKVKRAELRIRREERELEPLYAVREEAHNKLQRATARRWKAIEDENSARQEWTDAHGRIDKRERRIKDAKREIAELRGEC